MSTKRSSAWPAPRRGASPYELVQPRRDLRGDRLERRLPHPAASGSRCRRAARRRSRRGTRVRARLRRAPADAPRWPARTIPEVLPACGTAMRRDQAAIGARTAARRGPPIAASAGPQSEAVPWCAPVALTYQCADHVARVCNQRDEAVLAVDIFGFWPCRQPLHARSSTAQASHMNRRGCCSARWHPAIFTSDRPRRWERCIGKLSSPPRRSATLSFVASTVS